MTLTPAERRAAVTALYDWLATYARGVRPEGYADAESAAQKLEKEDRPMCDKAHYEKLEGRVDALEKTDVRHDEKISNIENALKWQAFTVWGAFLLCLLAIIYGAIGPKGFNAVSKAAPQMMTPPTYN